MDTNEYKELLKSIEKTETKIKSLAQKKDGLNLPLKNTQELSVALKKRKEEVLRLLARDEAGKGALEEAKKALTKAEIEERDLGDLLTAINQEIEDLQKKKVALLSTLQETKRLLWFDVFEILKQRLYTEIGGDLSKAYVAYRNRGGLLNSEMFLQDLFEGLFGKYGPSHEHYISLEKNIEEEFFS